LRLNKLCEIEDWALPGMAETMRRLMPDLAQTLPLYPFGYEHRKVWEYAHVLLGLDRIGALRPDAFVLSIGAGHEEPLTNRVRWVFAHGYLGQGNFMEAVAPSSIDLAGSGPFYRGDKTKARWEGSKMARNRLKPGMPAASGSPIESAGRLHVAGHVATNQLAIGPFLWGRQSSSVRAAAGRLSRSGPQRRNTRVPVFQ
jgi:hypothetical protein